MTQTVREALLARGVSTHHRMDFLLPDDCLLEPPCSLKWMATAIRLRMGAFSYAVSGYYQYVDIGRYVSIGEAVQVGRSDHPTFWASLSPVFYENNAAVLDMPIPQGAHVTPADFVTGADYPGPK
ncbi:MAG: hypothetical protein ABW173_10080, partial [Sphingomonas sp.]